MGLVALLHLTRLAAFIWYIAVLSIVSKLIAVKALLIAVGFSFCLVLVVVVVVSE